MRLRWILLPLGALVVIAAIGFYVIGLPPTLADDYEKKAQPEHEKLEDALRPAMDSFDAVTIGTVEVKRGRNTRTYIRRAERITRRDLRELASARRRVRRARVALGRIDEEAMTDSPSWPLIGGRGDLEEAGAVADAESAYLRKARAFLRDYDELIKYSVRSIRSIHRMGVDFAREEERIPSAPTSAGQITGPLNRAIRVAARHLRDFKRLKPPRPIRAEHRRVRSDLELFLRQQRDISAAIVRDDFDRVRRIERAVRRTGRRYDRQSRKDLDRILKRSRYRRQIDDLERRETKISQMFEDL